MLPQVVISIIPFTQQQKQVHSHKPSPTLMGLILAENIQNKWLLDIGCGSGGLTFELAPHAQYIVGVDISQKEIHRARELAKQKALTHVEFIQGDAEKTPYLEFLHGRRPDLIVANLCMSDEIIHKSFEALDGGSCLIFACFHYDQWIESGIPSRFAYTEERLREVLERTGFAIEFFQIEKEIVKFESQEEMIDLYFKDSPLKAKWMKDGRWERWLQYVRQGGRFLTVKSHHIVKARKNK
jgi:predicted TPR repeat methyltransferase